MRTRAFCSAIREDIPEKGRQHHEINLSSRKSHCPTIVIKPGLPELIKILCIDGFEVRLTRWLSFQWNLRLGSFCWRDGRATRPNPSGIDHARIQCPQTGWNQREGYAVLASSWQVPKIKNQKEAHVRRRQFPARPIFETKVAPMTPKCLRYRFVPLGLTVLSLPSQERLGLIFLHIVFTETSSKCF